jgi:hypothetical protein
MYAEDHGCLIVASAGDADKPEYPGGDPGVISVSAVNRKGLPVSQVEPGHGARVSIYAPGADLFSTGKSGSANHGYQRDIHGSDYAVAYVSVAAALLLSAGTSVDPEQAGQLLVSSSMPVAGGIPGAGVLDPIAALAHLTPIPVSSAPVRASSSSPAPVHPSGLPALAVGLVIIFFLLVAFGLIATVRTIRIRNRARVMWPPLGKVPGQQPYEPASWDQTW